MPRPAKPRRSKRLTQATLHSFAAPSAHSQVVPPNRKSSAQQTRPGKSRLPKDESGDIDDAATNVEPDVVSDDDEVLPRPLKRKSTRKVVADSQDTDHVLSSSADSPGGSDSSHVVRKKRRFLRSEAPGSESEEDMKPRRVVRGRRPPSVEAEDEDEEDEDDLMDEIDEERIVEARFRPRDKRSQYQENLEKLKRRKQGERAILDSSSSEEADDSTPFEGARPAGHVSSSDDEENDEEFGDSFIVQDGNTSRADLPAQFNLNTFQDLEVQFKVIFQLFVHLGVKPAEIRKEVMTDFMQDEYFAIPLRMTQRKVSSMRDSMVASSVWTPAFRKRLETCPNLELVRKMFSDIGCDACHIGGRISTILGRLSGDPYNKLTFESIANDHPRDDDEADDDDDGEETTKKKGFNLGRHCANRIRVFHRMSHWEHTLYNSLLLEIENLRRNANRHGFVQVAYSEGKHPPEDLSDANAIMDWLIERRVFDIELHNFQEMIDSAPDVNKFKHDDEGDGGEY